MLHSKFLAKPCCCILPGPNWGQQNGMPPEMGLEPSNFASGRIYKTSSPLGCFQEVTHAPNVKSCTAQDL